MGDLLTAILDRIEAVSGSKPGMRTKRYNVSRFYIRPPEEKKRTRIEKLRKLKIRTAKG